MSRSWIPVIVLTVALAAFATTVADDSGVRPVDLPAAADEDWWTTVRADIEASEYHLSWAQDAARNGVDAGWQAPNRANAFRVRFDERGVRIVPRHDDTVSWKWDVSLVAWGRPGAMAAVDPARLTVVENRVDADRGELIEWFVNDSRGLEQGFTLSAPPPGEGPLTFDLAVESTLSSILSEDGQAFEFALADGRRALHYGHLVVTDARGKILESRFEGFCENERCGIRIVVDDAGAAYPVTVDPLASSPAWVVLGVPNELLGTVVAPAGDVNGDGYDDVIVGAEGFDGHTGRALLYLGSPSGLSTTPIWSASGTAQGDYFGASVATAGDFNDDGYSDFLVGAPGWDLEQGAAYMYCGQPDGTEICWQFTGLGDGWEKAIGTTVACAGDVNGDGISDVAVGDPGFGVTSYGRVLVFAGASGGGDNVPEWVIDNPYYGNPGFEWSRSFGSALATAGDVNGDGLSDLAIGNPIFQRAFVFYGSQTAFGTTYWDAQGAEDGNYGISVFAAGDVDGDGYGDLTVGEPDRPGGARAYVYRGGPAGLPAVATWTLTDSQPDSRFGRSVGTAGDVNGDGFADLVVGAPNYHGTFEGTGRVYVYHGSAGGLSASSTWHQDGAVENGMFGYSVATAGDVNGDGLSDLIVGAPREPNLFTPYGRAYVYHGGAAGLDRSAAWADEGDQAGAQYGYSVASAGDTNGDGYSDVIVGAVLFDSGPANDGKVFVYNGGAAGVAVTPSWTATSGQAEARMGYSVSSAGDVNGDGYEDVLVGARGYSNPESSEGAAFVWHGSATGLGAAGTPANADWRCEGNQATAFLGIAVASAGDVNGDGFGDILVGASVYDDGQADEGAVFAWFGSATGLGSNGTPVNADWKATSNQTSSRFGNSLAGAGDVNGDGFGDVVIGAYAYDAGEANEGAAFLWLGSSTGLGPSGTPANADWSADGDQASGEFGWSVATAGDVNGDGYSDLVVGSRYWDGPAGADEGRASVFHGGASGPTGSPSWQLYGGQAGARAGFAARSAGDVNADGYADLVVGAPWYDGFEIDDGRAWVFHGGAAGLATTYAWYVGGEAAGDVFGFSVAGLGDVNADGYADIIVGAPYRDNPEATEGEATIYLGNHGIARAIKPGQYNGSGGALILPRFGRSNDDYHVRLTGKAFGLLGRATFQVESEIKPAGEPFDGLGVVRTVDEWDTGLDGHDFTARPYVGSGLHHWRLRPYYSAAQSPFQRRGRVYANPWAGWNEGDFRTIQDTDGDSIPNEQDNCPSLSNAGQEDADADGIGDVCDTCTDTDDDGFGDPGYPANICTVDNCSATANPDQADADADLVGDACDTCTDTDHDGAGDPGWPLNLCVEDNCPTVPNAGQQDGDADWVGDACDNCLGYANTGQEDFDHDGLGDPCDWCTDTDDDGFGDPGFPRNTCMPDNCADVPNPDQQDTDSDGEGDACDDCTDPDNDGFGNPDIPASNCPDDNCPRNYNPGQEDLDADGTGDVCDTCTDADGDGLGDPGFPANTCEVDCSPADGDLWSAPGDPPGLALSKATTDNLTWGAPAAGSTGDLFDLLKSRVAYDFGDFEAVCLETGGDDRVATDATNPAEAGDVYFYLVRSRNTCGSQMGTNSAGTPRVGRNCP